MFKIEGITNKIHCADCMDFVKQMPSNSISGLLCDPPYGLGFMGKDWDTFNQKNVDKPNITKLVYKTDYVNGAPVLRKKPEMVTRDSGARRAGSYDLSRNPEFQQWFTVWAKAMLRITKPGGFLLCFGGSRTFHRLVCAIEDAGWEIRDCISYLYDGNPLTSPLLWISGQGFPKSHNIKKALEKKYKCGSMEVDEEAKQKTQYLLRLVPKTNLSQTVNSKEESGQVLFNSLPKQDLQEYGLAGAKPKIGRQEQSGVEGRNYIETGQRELQRCKVCTLSEGLSGDGSEGWICNGTPFGYSTTHWSATPANRSCPSYRPQSKQQRHNQSNVISDKPSPQEIRGLIEKWAGYGTALKPSVELITVAMKPLDGTFAHNAEKHGVAGLNIDGGRIGTQDNLDGGAYSEGTPEHMWSKKSGGGGFQRQPGQFAQPQGRWPANLLLSCDCQNNYLTSNVLYGIIQVAIKETKKCQSNNLHLSVNSVEKRKAQSDMTNEIKNLFSAIECVKIDIIEKILGKLLEDIDTANVGCSEEMLMGNINTNLSTFTSGRKQTEKYQTVMKYIISTVLEQIIDSRISNVLQFQAIEVFITRIINGIQKEKSGVFHNKDCPVRMLDAQKDGVSRFFYTAKTSRKERNMGMENQTNSHPTVKPLALMRYLCTLLKMPGSDQIILDPFLGSGTTGIACKELGIDFIGIEKEQEYCEIAIKRIAAVNGQEITLHSGSPEKSLSVTKNVETVRTTTGFVSGGGRLNENSPHVSESRQRIINAASAGLRRNQK